MSHYLNNDLKVGDKLTVAGPFGDFTFTDECDSDIQRLVLIAGGSGITPILSILQTALERNDYQTVELIYCNRSMQSTLFKHEIEELEEQYKGRLIIRFVYSSEPDTSTDKSGRLSLLQLKELLATITLCSRFYICGPQGLNDIAKQALSELGVDKRNIYCETFVVSPREPQGQQFEVKIEMTTGTSHTIKVAENQTVLEVAKQQGIALPHACGAGKCGCCLLTRVEGEEAYPANNAVAILDMERQQGKTLACQCQPRSDMRLKVLTH